MICLHAVQLQVVDALGVLDRHVQLVRLCRGQQCLREKRQQGDVHVKSVVADLLRQRSSVADLLRQRSSLAERKGPLQIFRARRILLLD